LAGFFTVTLTLIFDLYLNLELNMYFYLNFGPDLDFELDISRMIKYVVERTIYSYWHGCKGK